ncbi:OmpA family protein [candidate division KSB1 bacterium]|nr:OmpA family protein [candidate division KSB1 bacterium]
MRSIAAGDSLQVKILNSPREVGKIRFIERDSSNLILRVMDETGAAFTELNSDQVEVRREDEIAKIIKVAPLQSTIETNLNIVLALDNSSSMQNSVKELLMSVRLLLDKFQGRSRISVVLFDEQKSTPVRFKTTIEDQLLKVKFLPFTEDVVEVMNYIRQNYRTNLTMRTYLHDEILVALKQFEQLPSNLLRVMILLSDGEDLGSKYRFEPALEAASKAGITIYGIDYSKPQQISETITQISEATPQGKAFKAKYAEDLIPVFEALTKEIITEFQVTFHFPIPPSGSIAYKSDRLLITERRLTDEFPMLSYVFFDSNSAAIDARYYMYDSPDSASAFDEKLIRKSLDKYYHLLNIVGSRAKHDSTANLIVTGCNMNLGAEEANLALSQKRAEAVSAYLHRVWGIDARRIQLKARNLPEKPSSIRTTEGQAENRRVEISSRRYSILEPIRSEITERIYQPEIGFFKLRIAAPEGLKDWAFIANSLSGALLKKSFQTEKTEFSWNWIDDSGERIHDVSQIQYGISITDQDNESFESAPKTIPVVQVDESTAIAETRQDSVFEKFSLILFDFNSSQIGGSNKALMQKVLNIYTAHPSASIRVYGFCDDIGNEDYNLNLSQKRAKIAHDILIRMGIPGGKLAFHGYGEINPIFSNTSPEGRFLNRTVQIYIGYPVEEVTAK